MNYEIYEVIVYENGDRFWYQNDNLHRLDGPAIEYDGDKSYWIDGKCYSYEDWKKKVNQLTNSVKELIVKQLFNILGYEVKIVRE